MNGKEKEVRRGKQRQCWRVLLANSLTKGEYITNALCEHINNRNCQVKVQHGATNRPTYNMKKRVCLLCVQAQVYSIYTTIELAKPAAADGGDDGDDVMFWAEFYRFYRNTHFKCSTN